MRFSPALCTWYEPHRLDFPCFAQPKLNGLRVVSKDGHFYSRSGNQWSDSVFEHVLKPLRTKCGRKVMLDGEFYRHGWTLDRIAEAVSLFRTEPVADTFEVGFYVFDMVADVPFLGRCLEYARLIAGVSGHVSPVPALRVDSCTAGDAIHELNLKAGFEGTIYRTGKGAYKGGRNSCLMKRKPTRGSGFTEEREFKPRVDRWSEAGRVRT